MNIQKIFFLNKFCVFREERHYLHSTDIFNQLKHFFNNKKIKNLEINFKKKIINYPYLIISSDPNFKIKNTYYISLNYIKNNTKYFGYIYQSRNKIFIRKKYNEKKFQQKLKLTKKSIFIPNNTNFDFIQRITSGAMKFLNDKNTSNNKGKWYIVRLKIRHFVKLDNKNFIKINLLKSNENAYFFSIYYKKKIGEMLFLKK
ncbi:hypothetical protein OAR76_00515 [Candidatus Pelagibacter sp.]|nr:hypothetical protein [Candidatus Pelagibacter sp.]